MSLLFILPFSVASAQQVKITDITNLSPLENVTITKENPAVSTLTDKFGIAKISEFLNADSIMIKRIGYQQIIISYQEITESNFEIALYPASYSLGEILVAASRFEEKREDVPVQVTRISATEIQNANQPTTADLLQQTGEVMVQKSQGGGGSPVIRGFEANKVLIVVDGVRMNNAIFRGGHLQNVISIDQSALDKTEIIFGPGSVVYGSDALGGVMHFYTKKPHLSSTDTSTEVSGSAFTRYSSAISEFTGAATFNIGMKNFASFTSVSFSKFGDVRAGKNRNPAYGDWGKREYYQEFVEDRDTMIKNDDYSVQTKSEYSQFGLMQKFLYSKQKDISHILNIQFTNTNDIPRYDRLTETDDDGVFTSAEWYYGPQTRLLAAYEFRNEISHSLFDNLSVIGAYQYVQESRHNRGFGRSNLNHREETVDIFSVNMDLEKRIKTHEIRYGAEITYNDVNSQAHAENIYTGVNSPISTRYPDGGSKVFTGGIYLTHTNEWNEKFILTEGLRFSYQNLESKFTDTTFYKLPIDGVVQESGALSGSIGLVYMPGHDWRFRLIGSTGYRAPNVDDLAKIFESTQGEVIVPNPDLKPEYTYNAELGVSKMILERLFIEGTAWYTLYKDAITTGDYTFNGSDSIYYDGVYSDVKANINAGEAYLYGFSGGINADISKNVSIHSTLTYTYGRIKTDTTDYPLDHIPPVTGKTSLNVSIQKFYGSFYVIYHGYKKLKNYNLAGEDNIQYASEFGTPNWTTLNISGNYTLNKHISIQAAVENIADVHYRVFASGISSPGRNFRVSLRANF